MRDYVINGEALVVVNFPSRVRNEYSWSSGQIIDPVEDTEPGVTGRVAELGLATGAITIRPRFFHKEIYTDAFGPRVPAEILSNLADCRISMTLIHYDPFVVEVCLHESMGGMVTGSRLGTSGGSQADSMSGRPGMLAQGTGRPLWGGEGIDPASFKRNSIDLPFTTHYMSLSILTNAGGALLSGQLVGSGMPHRFPTCYLTEPPMTLPLGTEKSLMQLEWRAVPCPILNPATQGSEAGVPTRELEIRPVNINGKRSVLWDHGVLRSGDYTGNPPD